MGEVSVISTPKLPIVGNLFQKIVPPAQQSGGTFYSHLRPIAVTSLLLGSLPLSGLFGRDGRKIRHCWFGLRVAWDIAVFITATYGYAYFALLSPSSRASAAAEGHSSYLTDLLSLLFVAHGCVQFILCHKTAPELPSLLAELEEAYQRHGVRGRLEKTIRRYGIWMFIGLLFMVAYSITVGYLTFNQIQRPRMEEIFTTPSYLFLTMPITASLFLYTFLVLSLEALFCDARKSLGDVLNPQDEALVDDQKLSDERLWYITLCDLVSKVEACFGAHIFINIGLLQAEMILEIYVFLVLRGVTSILLVTLIAYSFGMIFFITTLSSKVSIQGHMVLIDLRSVPASKLSVKGQLEVARFICQVIASPPQISASGYFVVDKSVITSVLSSVATYLIVLINFTPFFAEDTKK